MKIKTKLPRRGVIGKRKGGDKMQRDYLKGKMAENHKSGKYLAEKIGIHCQTFYNKFRDGSFYISEAETISKELGIDDPEEVVWVWATGD